MKAWRGPTSRPRAPPVREDRDARVTDRWCIDVSRSVSSPRARVALPLHTALGVRASLLVLGVFVLSACESGLSRGVKVTVPGEVASRFTPQAPGVVVAELGGDVSPFVTLCGQALPQPLELVADLGFGCLRELGDAGPESVRVWVQPVSPDAGFACSEKREYYSRGPTVVDGGVLAPTPEASWSQGTATGTWRRDGSPCGGVMNAALTLSN